MKLITTAGGILVLLAVLMACSFAFAIDQPFSIPSGMMTALKSGMFSSDKIPFSSIRAIPDMVKGSVDFVVKKILIPNVKYDPRISVVEVAGLGIPNIAILITILIILSVGGAWLYVRAIRSPKISDDFIAIGIFYIFVLFVREILVISGFGSWAGPLSVVLIFTFVLVSLFSGRGSLINSFRAFAVSLAGGLLILFLVFPAEIAGLVYEVMVRVKNLGISIFIDKNPIMVPLTIVAVVISAYKVVQKHGLQPGAGN